MNAYKEDLAFIHDVGFTDFVRQASPGLLALLRQGGIRDGRVVDLGCGSGLWARDLIDAGYAVVGIDISADMIEISRRRVPEAEFHAASFLDADLPPCRAVTSLGECFNYLFDQSNSLGELRRLFRRIFAALTPGGLLIFDVAEPGRGTSSPRVRHVAAADWDIVYEPREDVAARRLVRRITTFRRVGELYRRDAEVHELRLYRRGEVLRELRRSGFRARTLRGYGELEFARSYVGFIARKP